MTQLLGFDGHLRKLLVFAALQALLYALLALLSARFEFDSEESARPILMVLTILGLLFALSLYSIRIAVQCRITWHLAAVIFVAAAIYRLLLLPTPPIQEIDVYRYLWDGAATAGGVNPYRFAPATVSTAELNPRAPADLIALVRIRNESAPMREVLRRIHFAELSTIYPPVSQAIFAATQWLAPGDATIEHRVLLLKGVLTAFDLATAGLVWLLLVCVGRHPGWTVAYAWCPLVIKEIANTGHLDSIAVFLTALAAWCIVRYLTAVHSRSATHFSLLAALAVALAIGAKLYAVVLLPVFAVAVAKRIGVIRAAGWLALVGLISAASLTPMLLTTPVTVPIAEPIANQGSDDQDTVSATSGLAAFLTRWEMNDFLFLIVIENLRPEQPPQSTPAWFSIVPESWREFIVQPIANIAGVDIQTASFVSARALTAGVFLIIAMALARRVYERPDGGRFLEVIFLTLAWFWLLSPTQNPWYWVWAMPFLPFARGKAWYAMSGLVMVYYLRFWLQYHHPLPPTLGTAYGGTQFFDFVVPWIEYGPWIAWLAISAYRRQRILASMDQTTDPRSVASLTETELAKV
jgi:hypothetical protein